MDFEDTSKPDWKKARLGDFFRIKHGYAFSGEYFASSGPYILLTPGNFKAEGGLILKGEKEKYYIGNFPKEFLLQKGDLLVVLTDLTQNAPILSSPAFIKESDKFLHNQRLGKVVDVIESKMDRHFLYYLLNFYQVREQIKGSATGSTVKHTAPDRIAAVEVIVPPLPTQRQIASILSLYDDLIENNTRHIAILEEMARLLYEEWFVKFRFPGHEQVRMVESELGMIPEGWEIKPFSELVKIMSGGTPRTSNPDYWNGTIPFFTPKDAPEAFYILDTEKHITEEGLQSCHSQLYPANIIFITARGTVGKITLSSREMAMNQSCYALQGQEGISQYFLLFHLNHSMEYFKKVANGAVFSTIIVDTFKGIQVIKPPVHLIDRFHTEVASMFDLILGLLKKNSYLRRTRDKLLPKLISGEIDVSSWVVSEEEEEEARNTVMVAAQEPAMIRERGPVASIDTRSLARPSLWEET